MSELTPEEEKELQELELEFGGSETKSTLPQVEPTPAPTPEQVIPAPENSGLTPEEEKELQELEAEESTLSSPDLPVKQEQAVSVATRAGLKNLIGDSPKLQHEYLKRKGFETRTKNGQIQVKKPSDKSWGVVDPEGFDLQDVTDVVGDVVEMVTTGFGAVLGAGVGPLGSIAGAGAASGVTEAGKQALGKATGFREEFDPGSIAGSAALGAAGAGVGTAISAAARPIAKFGKTAAAKSLDMGKNKIQKLGPESFRELGEVARKEGLINLLKGTEGSLVKAQAKTKTLGKALENQYKSLDKKIITRMEPKQLINSLANQTKKEFPDPRAAKTITKELDNLLSTKKDLAPSDMWKLARELNKRAGTFTKAGTNQDFQKAGLLEEAANKLRQGLKRMADSKGMSKINTDAAQYHKLKSIENALESKLAGSLSKQTKVMDTAFGVLSDVINKSAAKAGSVASKVVDKAVPITAGSSIAARLSDLDKD